MAGDVAARIGGSMRAVRPIGRSPRRRGAASVSRGCRCSPSSAPGDQLLVRWGAHVGRRRLVVARASRPARTARREARRAPDGGGWWLEGDNPGASDDSRVFGSVPAPRRGGPRCRARPSATGAKVARRGPTTFDAIFAPAPRRQDRGASHGRGGRPREPRSRGVHAGVADVCLAIAADPSLVDTYTWRPNLVAVVTDGTAVLGLGDIGRRPRCR